VILWRVYGIRAKRQTFDVDVAINAVSWDVHAALVDPALGPPVPLDLVPFGGVEAPAGEIAWPPKDECVLNVLGLREAVDNAIPIDIGERVVVPVVSLPALAILKILAWHDRRQRDNKDAFDLVLLFRGYLKTGNEERIWAVAGDLLERYQYDINLTACALLGRDECAIARPETLAASYVLLADVG
jgi:predicted nucleotidyltransferase